MKIYPRSYWCPYNPHPVDTDIKGLPYFTAKPEVEFTPKIYPHSYWLPEVEFTPVGQPALYGNRNTVEELRSQFKSMSQGWADLPYNYAIAQNQEGAFTIRGLGTKCPNSENMRVLMLIGEHEIPTDVLKKNQRDFGSFKILPPASVLREGDHHIHVHDLIEYLTFRGYYQARNDGVFGKICKHAVQRLQFDLGLSNLDGVYDFYPLLVYDVYPLL